VTNCRTYNKKENSRRKQAGESRRIKSRRKLQEEEE
jgi:hypothetical protein